jgi:hypothetical protein
MISGKTLNPAGKGFVLSDMGNTDAEKDISSPACRFCLDESLDNPSVQLQMPFASTVSLLPLIEFWENDLQKHSTELTSNWAGELLDQINQAPELKEPITDLSILERHKSLVQTLTSAILPRASWNADLRAIVGIFKIEPIIATPGYKRLIPDANALPKAHIDPQLEFKLTLLYGYSMILNRLYGLDIEVDYPIIRSTQDPSSGFRVYLQVGVDAQFVRIRPKDGRLPQLSEEQLERIKTNPTDLDYFASVLPPDRFEFYGFMAIHALDVTDQRLLSEINRQLVQTKSIVCPQTMDELQEKLRSLFSSPDLELGLAAIQDEELMLLSSKDQAGNRCIVGDSKHYALEGYLGSPHEEAAKKQKTVIVDDLRSKPTKSQIEQDLIDTGIRNVAVSPLQADKEVIGVMELKSSTLGTLNPMNTMKIRELLPIFATAVQRSLVDFQNKVDGIIKRECTVIHPAVEWRFREAAADYLVSGSPEAFGNEAIAFKDVFPMYGASDIRNSSRIRNRSISDDLDRELSGVTAILDQVPNQSSIPILAQALSTCRKFLDLTKKEIRASDEYRITEFLQTEIHELLELLAERNSDLRASVQTHLSKLDPQHKTFFETRQAYMESVATLNKTFGSILDKAQEDAQKIYPHYFEKHSTDGVDFTLYIGESLCRNRSFHPLYLDNLRLWQIILMCDLACANHALKSQLSIPLETTHLIAVQDHPVSIRFRFDERLFDVDGAYNARYEIMKKRIDKARVKGRSERLTQPDKIAIVYSNAKEAAKYRKHLDYLQNAGYLIPGFEDLQVEDLQGVEGLQAMRVTVNLDRAPQETPTQHAREPLPNPSSVW